MKYQPHNNNPPPVESVAADVDSWSISIPNKEITMIVQRPSGSIKSLRLSECWINADIEITASNPNWTRTINHTFFGANTISVSLSGSQNIPVVVVETPKVETSMMNIDGISIKVKDIKRVGFVPRKYVYVDDYIKFR